MIPAQSSFTGWANAVKVEIRKIKVKSFFI